MQQSHAQLRTNTDHPPSGAQCLQPRFHLHNFEIAQAIHQRQLSVHMSQLMGCDYIFVSYCGQHPLLSQEHLALSIQELVDILEVSIHHAVVILVDVDSPTPSYQRCEFTRHQGRVEKVSPQVISSQEQLEFFQMIFECSDTY